MRVLSCQLLRPADDLQHMRVMERRFIIWTPPDAPGAESTQQQQPQRRKGRKQQQPQSAGGEPRQQGAGGGEGAEGGGSGDEGGGSGGQQGGAWDRGLAGIWREFTQRLEVRGCPVLALGRTSWAAQERAVGSARGIGGGT